MKKTIALIVVFMLALQLLPFVPQDVFAEGNAPASDRTGAGISGSETGPFFVILCEMEGIDVI